jgi:hypothetical protein
VQRLPRDWRNVLYAKANSGSVGITPFALIFAYWIEPYKWYAPSKPDAVRWLQRVIGLWVNTLHDAGIDLAAYAGNEVWRINRILLGANSRFDFICRLLHGPEPDDWKLETGPFGEAYPAYFWRGIEAIPIGDDLETRVLDLMHWVEHPKAVCYNVPGRWTRDWDAANEYTLIIKGWLASMEDSDLAQMEVDLEELDAEEFYRVWDLSFLVNDRYDGEDTEGFDCTEGSEDSGCTEDSEDSDDSNGSRDEQ